MRGIKLGKVRIWDKVNKKWYVPIYETYKGKLDDLSVCLSGDLNRRIVEGIIHESMFPDQYEVNYYIGLKDKNNKELYEDDIVDCGFADGHHEIGVVKFIDGCFDVVFSWGRDYVKCFIINHAIEIIGNEYVNPELLKGVKS